MAVKQCVCVCCTYWLHFFDCPGKVVDKSRNCTDKIRKQWYGPILGDYDGKLEVDRLHVSLANDCWEMSTWEDFILWMCVIYVLVNYGTYRNCKHITAKFIQEMHLQVQKQTLFSKEKCNWYRLETYRELMTQCVHKHQRTCSNKLPTVMLWRPASISDKSVQSAVTNRTIARAMKRSEIRQ